MTPNGLIENFKGLRIVVLADLVADVFVYGEISRVSREAPVLILSHNETQLAPGGGANAIHNLWALGATPLPVGIVGNDSEGNQLINYFESLGIDTRGINKIKSYRTPTKTRILAGAIHSQPLQVLRLDKCELVDGGVYSKALKRTLCSRLKKADAVLISDYGYGAVTKDLTEMLAASKLPATIDSRFLINLDLSPSKRISAALGLVQN